MKSFFSRRLSLLVRSVAACVCSFACATLPTAPALADTGEGPLTVAMRFVPPPFIGGAKVRTPETMDTVLAQAVAARLNTTLKAVSLQDLAASAKADILLVALPGDNAIPPSTVAIATGYVARPMAIMRTDTDIKSWQHLKGRTVCLSQGGLYIGTMAAQYDAVEKIFKAPADSLLALRTGECDAAVHDDRMLKELLKLPEWKKFSASLPPGPETALTFIVPADNTAAIAALDILGKEWRSDQYLSNQNRQRVRDIAFEVYLDQAIPDCH